MLVLVSTRESQGTRSNDFCFVPEGELVLLGSECSREDVDGACGCKRSVVGINERTATTTFKVAEVPITKEEYLRLIEDSERRAGFLFLGSDVQDLADQLLTCARRFPVGTILEKRGNYIGARTPIVPKRRPQGASRRRLPRARPVPSGQPVGKGGADV